LGTYLIITPLGAVVKPPVSHIVCGV